MKIPKANFHIAPETSQLGWPATGTAGDGDSDWIFVGDWQPDDS
jgi:hypothetical protein